MAAKPNIHVERITTEMIQQFEAGTIPARIAESLIARAAGHPEAPCASWSHSNQLIMTWLGRTNDARGYRQWQAVGRYVKAGSKAIHILAPMIKKWWEQNDVTGEREQRSYVFGFKAIKVFRVEDTDGDPLFEEGAYDPPTLPPLANVAEAFGVTVEYAPSFGQSWRGIYDYTDTNAPRIELLTHDMRTWMHELAHAAHHRVAGDKAFKTISRERKEVVAEFSSAVLQRIYLGVDATGNANDYIQSWTGNPLASMLGAIKEVVDVVTHITDTDAVTAKQDVSTAA